MASSPTKQLQIYLNRMHAGDAAAREELFKQAGGRLERLTRKMLRGFPGVKRWAQTDDVLQNALMRLLRALKEVHPASMREFYALSAEQIRRELVDLARHFFGPEGTGANHATNWPGRNSDTPPYEKADVSHDPGVLAGWHEFHNQVHKLPPEEREVVDLLFYQDLPQADAAALLNVSVRTVQRRWQSALLKLHQILKGQWPGL